MTEGFQEFRVSNDAIEDPEELQRRIDAEGYLFFRALQDPGKLWALRRDILPVCRDGGSLREGTELTVRIAPGHRHPRPSLFLRSRQPGHRRRATGGAMGHDGLRDRRYLDLPQPDGAPGAPQQDGRPAADLAG